VVERYQRFGGQFYLHFQDNVIYVGKDVCSEIKNNLINSDRNLLLKRNLTFVFGLEANDSGRAA
jgi:hypothetical protein